MFEKQTEEMDAIRESETIQQIIYYIHALTVHTIRYRTFTAEDRTNSRDKGLGSGLAIFHSILFNKC